MEEYENRDRRKERQTIYDFDFVEQQKLDIEEPKEETKPKKKPVIQKKINLYAKEEKPKKKEELVEIDEDSLYYDEELDNVVRKKEILYGEKREKEKVQTFTPKKTRIKALTEKVIHYGKLAAVILIPITIISLISIIILKNTNYGQYKLGYIAKGAICEVGSGESYFIRKTESVLSPSKGVFVQKLEEGTRVDAGAVIGYITTEDNKNVVSKLKQISASISTLLKLDVENVDSKEKAELEDLQKVIDERRLELVEMSRGGSLDEINDIKEEMDILLLEMNELILKRETEDESINTLKRQQNELLLLIEEEMIPVIATRSGFVSYSFSTGDEAENEYYAGLSGGEGVNSLSEVTNLQKRGFRSVVGTSVDEGSQVARLIVEQDYYLILKLEVGELVKNQILTLESKDQTFNTTGYVLSTSLDDGYAIISASRGISGCLSLRKTEVSYDLEKYSGYCVHASSLTKQDKTNNTAKIAVLRNNRVQFITVKIDAMENDKVIISQGVDDNGYSFKTGDCYIVNPKNIRNGQKISS